MEKSLTMGIGFRHVVEDALDILNRKDIDQNRRDFVIEDLSELLQEAMRGLALERQDSLFVGSANRTAFDTFQFFDHYLSTVDSNSWRNQLPIVIRVFQKLRENENIEDSEVDTAKGLFNLLLKKSRWQDNTGVPQKPQNIQIA